MGPQVHILLKKDPPVLYVLGAQASILLKRHYPVLCIVGAQALLLLKRESAVLYIVGAEAPYFSVLFSGTVCDTVSMHRICFSIGA